MSTTTTSTKTQREPSSAELSATPPVGEEIHLPGPSWLPLICAAGITLAVIGLTIWWVYSVLGVVIFAVSTAVWIRDTRRDVSELPEEHGH